MKKNSFNILLLILVTSIYFYHFSQIDKNLDSIFDEGTIYLKLQAAQNNEIDGFSQWPTIVNYIFGKKVSSSLIYLRYARYLIHLLSVTLFAVVTAWYSFKIKLFKSREQVIRYILLVYLFGTLVGGGISLAYNHLQEFFVIGVVSSFIIAKEAQFGRKFFYFLAGIFSFFSIMTILPSGILVFVGVLILIINKEIKSPKNILFYISSIFTGFFVAAIYYHYFIYDLFLVYSKMIIAKNAIIKLERGYDVVSYATKVFLYFRDFYIQICAFIGVIVVSSLVAKFTKRSIAYILCLLSIVILTLYIKRPEVHISTLLVLPIIVSFIAILFETDKNSFAEIFSSENCFNLFLFFFPLFSSIGTITPIADKMIHFILPWSLLTVKLMNNSLIKDKYKKEISFSYWIILFLILFPPLKSFAASLGSGNHEKYKLGQESKISPIALTKKQREYFEYVNFLIKKYDYRTGDFVFSTQLDHMTIVAISATPCGIYFQPVDFHIDEKKYRLHKPDFVFLTEYDSSIIYEDLRSLNWGFPDSFDRYFVGTPETLNPGYATERILYCRHSRKLADSNP